MHKKSAARLIVLALASLALSGCKNNTVEPPAPAPRFDLFPLAVGAHYTYLWQSWDHSGVPDIKDSGLVEYRVKDSAMVASLDTVVWTVEETRHLWHIYDYDWAQDYDWSKGYWVDSTVNLTVKEARTGQHELQCSSLVWSFPLFRAWEGDVDFPTGYYQQVQVYRFARTPGLSYKARGGSPGYGILDSVCLAPDSGLTYMIWSHSMGGADQRYRLTKVQMISKVEEQRLASAEAEADRSKKWKR